MHFHNMFARGCAPVRLIGTVSWTMLDLCSLAADNLDDRARRIQVVTAPLPGLLQPQVTVTDCGVDASYCVLPVDMRCLPGGEVVAVPFCSGMELPDIIQAILHEIPDCRSSLDPLVEAGEIYVQDCNGFVIEQLFGVLPAHQWLALRRGRPPFAGALSICTSTTTTPPAIADAASADNTAAVPANEWPSPRPVPAEPPALLFKNNVAASLKAGSVHSAGPQLLPTYLGDARFQHGPVCDFSWGTDDEQQDTEMFTVFDVVRHWTVQRRDRHATLPHLIEAAVRAAPFGVRSVHILTVPVAGLPKPQMSLGRDRDPAAMWPLPWDLRPVGGDIRTAGHFPGEELAEFAGKVQQLQPDLPRLRDDMVSGQVAVTDALGFVGGALSMDLEQVQYFQVESHLAARLHVDTLAAMHTGPNALGGIPTSTTTTNPVGRPIGVIYRVVLLWGDCSAQEQIWPPCRQLDGILSRLVRDVFACAPRHPPSHEVLVTLAKEQPPLTDGIQEILFFVLGPDYDACPVVVVDERAGGHGLQATRLSHRARCDSLVNPAWRREGVSLVVNGAPENLAQRCADTGDLLQFADQRGRPRSRPLASLFDAFPALVPYAWPLSVGPRSDQLNVTGTARERRTAQGMWRHKEGACLVLGPSHGPVCFRLGVPVVPSRVEAAQGLALLDWRCPAHLTSLHETALIAPNRATFATALPAAPFCTVLIAHMDWPAHQTILLILPKAIVVGPLPVRPRSLCRRPARDWRDGDVISVTEVADAAIPAYEALAAAEIPHSIPICPPASAAGQDLIAPPARVPSLTVARADTPIGEHIGWSRVPRPRPQSSDEPSSSAGGSGLSLLQTDVKLKRAIAADAGLPVARSRVQVDAARSQPVLPHVLIPTPLGRRRVANCTDAPAPRSEVSPKALHGNVHAPSSAPPQVLNLSAQLPPPSAEQELSRVIQSLRAPWQHHWRGDLCSVPSLPVCFLKALHHCVPRLDVIQHVHIFTDGSFISEGGRAACGWGVCTVFEGVHHGATAFAFAGYAGGPIDAFLQRPLGADNTSYFAEVAAAIVAVTWQLSLPSSFPATLWYDCQAVGGVIDGSMSPKGGQGCLSLASRLRAVVHLVESVRGCPCNAKWLPSHTGNPFNELADCVAKAGARFQLGESCLPDVFWALLQSPLLPWAWMLHCGDPSLPRLTQILDGAYEEGDIPPADCIPSPCPPAPSQITARVVAKVCSCNVQTLKDKKPLVIQQFLERKVHIAGLQETRLTRATEIQGAAFFEFFTAAQDGEGGCALLFNRRIPYAWKGLQPLFFERTHFTCVHSSHRLLVIRVKAPLLDVLVVSAHAPQSGHGAEAVEAWWHEFMRAPWLRLHQGRIIACIDANAQLGSVESQSVGRHAGVTETHAGSLLREWLDLAQAFLPATFYNQAGHCIPNAHEPTWISPSGCGYRIDYVALPVTWSGHPCSPSVLNDFELLNKDHLPVQVEVSRCTTGQVTVPKRHSPSFTRDPDNWPRSVVQKVKAGMQHLPALPWAMNVHAHMNQLLCAVEHVGATAKPRATRRCRSFVSEHTRLLLEGSKQCRKWIRTLDGLKEHLAAPASGHGDVSPEGWTHSDVSGMLESMTAIYKVVQRDLKMAVAVDKKGLSPEMRTTGCCLQQTLSLPRISSKRCVS